MEENHRPAPEGGDEQIDWQTIADSSEFVDLEAARRRVMLATLGVFAVAFGVFLVLCGYARPFMTRSVDGGLTVAYVWLLCLTVLAWILVFLYLRFAERQLEPASEELARRFELPGPEEPA